MHAPHDASLTSVAVVIHACHFPRAPPLLPLLQAVVKSELVSQQEEETAACVSSGFDGASTKPPSDVILGSSDHQQDCIGKLQHALHETKSLKSLSQEQQQQVQRPLVCLSSFLESLATDVNDHAMAMLVACAQSMSSSSSSTQNHEHQPSRIRTAADFYVHDLQILQSRLFMNPMTVPQPQPHPPLHLERRLVDSCGQGIRHSLRTILNPVPCRVCWDEKLDTVRISDLIQMKSSTDSTAVKGGPMSSLSSVMRCDAFMKSLGARTPNKFVQHQITSVARGRV
jgi:hypothetical protein